MPRHQRRPRAARILLGLTIAAAVVGSASITLDSRVAVAVADLPPSSVAWGWLLSDVGSSGWMFAVSALVAIVGATIRLEIKGPRGRARASRVVERASFLFATLCTESLAVQAVKHLVGRARPYEFATFGAYHFEMLSMTDALASFPSGHTATAFSMALAISLMAPGYRAALYTLAIGIALSRIVVQAHYVSDILVGSLFGTGAALLIASVFARHGWVFATQPCRSGSADPIPPAMGTAPGLPPPEGG